MSPRPEPFQLFIPETALADLKARLAWARFPDQAPDGAWAYGTELEYMRGLVDYWKNSFDWRAQEAALNAYPQFKVKLHGTDVHYLHVPGRGPSPMPLLLMHGWPGSVFESSTSFPA
jgi:microsomal epoxide hydrolase